MSFNLLATGRVAALVAGAALAGTFTAAPASAAVQAGVLTCNVAGGIGAVIASQKAISCAFKPSNRRAPIELYTGSITRIGLDLSATGTGTLTYNVVSSADAMGPYSLAGGYSGPGVGLTLGSGLGVDALVGGNANQVALQPIAVSTSQGLGINAGIGTLTLVAAGEQPRFRRHRHRFHG